MLIEVGHTACPGHPNCDQGGCAWTNSEPMTTTLRGGWIMPITREEIMKILEAYAKIKEEHGQKIQTAVLFDENGEELVLDNREPEEIN
jgi:hypothetical protein